MKNLITSKAPNILLLDKNQNFKAFGYEAETMYTSMCTHDSDESDDDDDKGNPTEVYYFNNFNVDLASEKVWRNLLPL